MTSVCFTGKGKLGGQLITRDLWMDAANKCGYFPVDKPGSRGILVASLDNTTKAAKARAQGTSVMTYEEFAGELRMAGATHVGTFDLSRLDSGKEERAAVAERAEREIKAKLKAQREKERREQEAFAELEENPLWGQF